MKTISLAGKVALITGASREIGIGNAIALALADAGADIFITYYHPYDAEMPWGDSPNAPTTLVGQIREKGRKVDNIEIDLSDPTAPKNLFDKAVEVMGKVDILVNNATVSINAEIHQLTAELIDRHYAVNVRGMMLLCAEFCQHWDTRSDHNNTGGRIINMTSGQGIGAMPDNLPYAATKGSVDAFTVSLVNGVMQRGITVNAVDPGGTDTGWMSDEFKADLARLSPAGRVGLPDDAARLICWLASDDSRWITGQILRSRGGI
jgi:3-oxoacyl-[acyl-carrier protein] reductase